MQITFKLYATLANYLPPGSEKHSVKIDIPDTVTPNELIDRYSVPRDMAFLVLLNGIYLKPEDRDKGIIKDGDILAIWPPVAGGRA